MPWNSIKLSRKLPALIVSVGAVAAIGIGAAAYLASQSAVHTEVEQKLTALLDARKSALTDWLTAISGDLAVQSQNLTILEALTAFSAGWQAIEGDRTAALQSLYIDENPNPVGQKENLDAAADGSLYSQAHARFHPYVRAFLRDRGYYDIFLFDTDGNLIYSVYKELDFATNLVSGEWAGSDLGNAFRAAQTTARAGEQSFFDFQPYAPSAGAPASFMSTPLFDDAGQMIGVLAFQMPIERLNTLMQQSAGLGETGETYIVGGDLLMRSDSRFSGRIHDPGTRS